MPGAGKLLKFLSVLSHSYVMADKVVTPVIIGVLVGLVVALFGVLYYIAFLFEPGGTLLRMGVVVGTVMTLGALGYVVWQRMQEIKQEDPDDYRKY